MCGADAFIEAITSCFNLHRTFRFSFVVVTIAMILHMVGFSTPFWVKHESAKQGLWTHCSSDALYECCEPTGDFHSEIPGWLVASRVFHTFGLVGAIASFTLVMCIPCCGMNGRRKCGRPSAVVALLFTTVSLLIGVSIYGGQFRSNQSLTDYKISESFVCSIIALVGFLICCILMIFVNPDDAHNTGSRLRQHQNNGSYMSVVNGQGNLNLSEYQSNVTMTESIINAIETFFQVRGAFQFTFVFINISAISLVIAYSIPEWIHHDSSHQGLWDHCSAITSYECCNSLYDFYDGVPVWLNATRAFLSFGLFGSVLSCIVIIIFTCVPSKAGSNSVRRVAVVVCLFTAVFLVIGVSIYGGKYRSDPVMDQYFLSASFIISTIAAGLFVICCVLLFFVTSEDTPSVHPAETGQPSATTQPQPSRDPPPPYSQPPPGPVPPPYRYVEPSAPPPPEAEPRQPIPNNNLNDGNTCVVCLENEINTFFEPCAHRRCCDRCAEQLAECPMCRAEITQRRRVY